MSARICFTFAFLLSFVSSARQFLDQGRDPFASSAPGGVEITGQIVAAPGTPFSALSVELCEPGGGHLKLRETTISGTGTFFFSGVPSALYLVRVTDRGGEVLAQEYVDCANGIGRVQIRLEEEKKDSRAAVVSLSELVHKVPPKAQKEADAANKALGKHDLARYISHLEKAVTADPEFAAARKNLALAYLKIREYQKGIEAMKLLLRLDPKSLVAHGAIAAANLDLHRYIEAETAAARMLEIDPSAELGHFLLGCSLAAQDKDRRAALDHLGKAARRYPTARIAAAAIWSREGHDDEAKDELHAYLDSGDQDARAEAENMLNKL